MAERSNPLEPGHGGAASAGGETFFRALIEHTLDVVSVLDANLIIRFESPSVKAVLGYEPVELVGTHGFQLVHPDDASRLLMLYGPQLDVPDAAATFEYRTRHKDGHWVVMEGAAANRLYDPAVRGIVLNSRDVTDRRRMEEAVKESERRLRGLIEHSLDGVAVVDASGQNVFNGDALGRIMGYPAEELSGRSAFDIIHPGDLSLAQEVFARVLGMPGEPVSVSVRALHRDGSYRDLSLVVVNRLADTAIRGVVVHFRDVTQERILERELAVQRQRLEAFFSSAPVGLVILDEAYRYVQINRPLADMHALPIEAHIGRTVHEVLPHLVHLITPVIDQVLETGRPLENVEWHERTGEDLGHLHRIRGSFFPLETADGHRHVGGIVADITEQRAVQDALRHSEERYRQIVETTNEGVWLVDMNHRTEYVNRQMAQILGYEPDELIGRSVLEFIDPSHQAEARASFERRRQGVSERLEFCYRHRDGHAVWAEVAATPVLDDAGRMIGALAMMTDVSERKALEEQFRHAQKMEAIGRLAGGIAHDFNNLLTAILGQAQLLVEDGKMDPVQAQGVDEIIRAVESAARLTRQLLAFSRRQVLQPVSLDLNEVVESLRGMLTRVIGEDIALETRLGPDIGAVHVDRGQVEQLLMNLVVNARDAMPEGGRLVLSTVRRELTGDEPLDSGALPAGPYVELAVSDTGIGMDARTRQHLFEPFFTTKGNLGTGLGLATVYGIVTQSDGGITVTTAPGQGSTFRLYLPISQRPVAAPEPEARRPASRTGGSEAILVVEDEDGVRVLISRVLRRGGYQVTEARTPDEALRLAGEQERTIDLMLTDVVMPGMNGAALADAMAERRPGLKVLFMSGYSEPDLLARSLQRPGAQLLRKPFSPAVLIDAVAQALARRT
ncbi:MAG: PAS domain S-box protein [Acidobacteriota bacterium]|nr:PAS domain S-box protein [Acidobacteriota bacterium]